MNNEDAIKILNTLYSIDVYVNEALDLAIKALEERSNGEWISLHAIGDYKCSICGAENLYKYAGEHEQWIKTNSNFCPNCGADMRVSK